ncbi:MAG: alpha-L-fucosidase [Bacteroidales bacterium]
MKNFLFTLLFVALSIFVLAQQDTNPRAQWFVDSRYGMFIHWGVYSGAEGYWKGEKLRDDNNYAEWIYYRNRIDKEEYVTLLDRFDWDEIDPEEWVILAKKAGMKYLTFTAKHHDGFALWDSDVSDYDVADYTEPSRDIVKELSQACKKHGIKFGLYYSHWVDWAHPYGWDHTREIYDLSEEEYAQYWQEKVIPQMRELLTQYGNIDMIWFDMWIHHSDAIVTKEQLMQLKNMIRELQPDCLINSRLGLSLEEDSDIDFKTLGDNQLGDRKEDFPWQSPATVSHSWGYHRTDTEWKSVSTLLQSLISNVSLNGNFMLNIGPRSDGSVPHEMQQRLLKIGQWLEVNGESVYGASAFDLPKDQHDWGRITKKQMPDGSTRLYMHLFNWPYNEKLNVTGITSRPERIYMLSDKQEGKLEYQHTGALTTVELPEMQTNPYNPVLVMEYDGYPSIKRGLAAKNLSGGFSLTPENANKLEGDTTVDPAQKRGSIPPHVQVKHKSRYSWQIYVDGPKTLKADVSCSFQGNQSAGTIKVTSADSMVQHKVKPTGMTVGEPNSDWHIKSFESQDLGKIKLPEAGYYNISLEIEPEDEPIDFQWLWLEER